jgi:ferrous iron transport protein B
MMKNRLSVRSTNGMARPPEADITVALAGQPNVGKSTVFNLLTGLDQHVGNWPGKTVEKRTGTYQQDDTTLHIIDLPGICSLTAQSTEERIARNFIIAEQPDAAIVIANAAALERGLYLLAEILWLQVPVVLGLNMVDVAEQQGIHVEPHVLEAALGLPVVPMVAARNQGVRELVEAVRRLLEQPAAYHPNRLKIRQDYQDVVSEIQSLIADYVLEPYLKDWVALKLLEGDDEMTAMMRDRLLPDRWVQVQNVLRQHESAVLAIAGDRYEWVGRMVRAAVVRPRPSQVALTDRIDRFATHPLWGLLLLLGVMGGVFGTTYAIGIPLQEWLDGCLVQGARWLHSALVGTPSWFVGLLADGVIGGAGMVITLLPILIIFFAAFGLLEDTGYMVRAAFVMDRPMHWMGLHGNSFIPLCLGFGCNVPAVIGTRIIDSPRSRLLTILLAPLVPCKGRMAVVTVLAAIFFGRDAALISWGLLGFNLVMLSILGIAFHKVILAGEQTAFIMELPLYHMPNLRTVGLSLFQRTMAFVRNAGSIILALSVLAWGFSRLPGGAVETSYLAQLGRLASPAGSLLGLNWQMIVGLLTSIVAKENTIATLAVLYGVGREGVGFAERVAGSLTPAAALAFLTVQMLFIPCTATIATIRHETGSWKWTLTIFVLYLVLSFAAGIIVYQVAQLIL